MGGWHSRVKEVALTYDVYSDLRPEKSTINLKYSYSTARFKLHAREYILASAYTFSPSSQPMLASKGSMLASKGSMLSCMILLAIEADTPRAITRTHPASCSQ